MTRDELEGLIGNAIIEALEESGYRYTVDEIDAMFLQDCIEDMAHIYFDSKDKKAEDYQDDEDNRKEDIAMEKYYERKHEDKKN